MGRCVRKIVFWTSIITPVIILIIVIFVVWQLVYFPIDKLAIGTFSPKKVPDIEIRLEEGSLVNESELKSYYIFSKNSRDYDRWISEKKKLEEIIPVSNFKINGLLAIKKDQIVKELMINDCQHIYCFQKRVEFDQIPSVFWKGLIGIEDYRFINHVGIDFKSLGRALITDIKEMRLAQGGSTLTQQLVKNLFLTNKKTFSRKIKEIIYSVYLETRLSKEEILRAYFNEVFWGSLQGIRIKGIYSASLFYFGLAPNKISAYQVSILTALLKGPNYYHPIRHLDRLIKRTDIVFNKLVEKNFFSRKLEKVWNEADWKRWQITLLKRDRERPYFAIWEAMKNRDKGIDSYEKFILIKKSRQILSKIAERLPEKLIAIKILIQNISDSDEANEFSYYSQIERNKKNALENERHQVGSTLKPLIFRQFVRRGKALDDLVSTRELTLNLLSQDWSPAEAHEIAEEEVMLKEALQKSYNRPVVRLTRDIGFEEIEKDLLKYIPRLQSPLAQFPAQLLGAVELSMRELLQAYRIFFREECEENMQIQDVRNSVLFQMIDPNLTTIRKLVVSELKGMRFFGKTGTSNRGEDNWFVFFDGTKFGAIWVGLEGKRGEQDLHLYGGSTSFQIFQQYYRDKGKRFNEFRCR